MKAYYPPEWTQPSVTMTPLQHLEYSEACLDTCRDPYAGFLVDVIPDEEIIDANYPEHIS